MFIARWFGTRDAQNLKEDGIKDYSVLDIVQLVAVCPVHKGKAALDLLQRKIEIEVKRADEDIFETVWQHQEDGEVFYLDVRRKGKTFWDREIVLELKNYDVV